VSYNIYINESFTHGGATVVALNGKTVFKAIDAHRNQIVRYRIDGKDTLFSVSSCGAGKVSLSTVLGKFYLAGPMRGHAHYNFPAFLMAKAHLTSLGFVIVDPATHDLEGGIDVTKTLEEQGFDTKKALGWDFQQIVDCRGIIMLDGWEKSSGAKAERLVAEMTGKEILRLNSDLKLFAEEGWEPTLTWEQRLVQGNISLPMMVNSEKP
jgi:hypothetical protein